MNGRRKEKRIISGSVNDAWYLIAYSVNTGGTLLHHNKVDNLLGLKALASISRVKDES